MTDQTPTVEEFLSLPTSAVHELVYPQQLSMSLLLNGTRRWYIAQHFDQPPTNDDYFLGYLQSVLHHLGRLIEMVAEHGVYRIFMPTYSWYQPKRNPNAHKYLLKGIEALTNHPDLVSMYERIGYGLWFYGDMSHFPDSLQRVLRQPLDVTPQEPKGMVYYGIEGGNPYDHTFQLAYEFAARFGRAPTWNDMLEIYYGDRTLRRLDILVGFNRIYSRGGIPHLLEGGDRIYTTMVTPLVLNETTLRLILYDYLYNNHDFGRDYKDMRQSELDRLKQFYAANQNSVLGLMRKFEDLSYPEPKFTPTADFGASPDLMGDLPAKLGEGRDRQS